MTYPSIFLDVSARSGAAWVNVARDVIVLLSLAAGVLGVFAIGLVTALARPRGKARIDAGDVRPLPDPAPLVSICVPARNEEAHLDACLAGLRAQDYPRFELLVVDDRSTDRTGEILQRHAAADARVTAIAGEEPPPGWFGKPNALRQAIARARGEWLLMTDADTVHAASSLRASMGYAAAERIAAVSILPKVICDTFWAKLLAPQLGALLFAGRSFRRINDPRAEAVFGNGQYFLVRRDAYEAAGGLAAVKDALDEDVAFARRLKATGLGYHFAEGETICAAKIYSTLGEFFRGFGKNTWSTLEGSLVKLAKLTAVLWLMSLVPLGTAIVSASRVAAGEAWTPALAFGVGQYFAVLSMQMIIRAKAGFPAWIAVFAPLGGMLAWAIFAGSAYRGLTGKQVTWKGRTYDARPRA